jgi:dTDP-4-amino-4,6-dideoxygalactose transaminase
MKIIWAAMISFMLSPLIYGLFTQKIYEKFQLLQTKKSINNKKLVLSPIQAKIGNRQLKKLDQFNNKRIENAKYIYDVIKKHSIFIPPRCFEGNTHVYLRYGIRVNSQLFEGVRKDLRQNHVDTWKLFPTVCSLLPEMKSISHYSRGDFPISERVASELFNIPNDPYLTPKQLKIITTALDLVGEKYES